MTFLYTPPSSLNDPTLTPDEVVLNWTASALITAGMSMLLHFDGTNGSTTVLDSSPVGNVMASLGGASLDTTSPMFGTASLKITSTLTSSTQAIRTPITSASPLDVLSGTGDFTIEGWLRVDSGAAVFVAMDYGSDQSSFNLNGGLMVTGQIGVSGGIVSLSSNITNTGTGLIWGGFTSTADLTMAHGTWRHFAIVRKTGQASFYVNGVAQAVQGNATWANYTFPATSYAAFGRSAAISGGLSPGHVDEILVTKGTAKYIANFTPPTAPFASPGPPPAYIVDRDGVEIAQVLAPGITSYTDVNVVVGHTYVYKVAAQDGSNTQQSDFSAPLSVTIPFADQHLFMPFVPASIFKPIVLANLKGIKPRIYAPIENNTVSTKQ